MALNGNTTEEKIWNFLKNNGLTDCGAAGLMGNLYAESALKPTNLQNTYEQKLGMNDAEYTKAVDEGTYTNFVRDSAGYGLAQWTYWSRKQNLQNFAKDAQKSIGDLEMQLGFLIKELNGYSTVMSCLKAATSVLQASNSVLINYERPANQGATVQAQRAKYGQAYFDKYAAPNQKEDNTMATKITTGTELAARAKNVAQNFKTLYIMGCFGAPMNDANKNRYCNNHSYNKNATRTAMIRAASADTFGFDCVCLIKGLLWGWDGDTSKTYGGAGYACNGVPDIGADSMINVCKGVSTDFSKIETGEAVWMEGHIGIYIGGGLAVECTPKWANKVQITACNCSKSGYNTRNWTKHGKLPYVSYTGSTESVNTGTGAGSSGGSTVAVNTSGKLKVGDIVEFTGSKHYANANAATGPDCKPGKAKVTATYNGKHPYHLIAISGGGSNVYGWVDAADIKGTSSASAPAAPWTPAVGDTVNYNGSVHYANANATSGPACKGGKAKITAIYQLGRSKHPYHLVRVTGSGATVYGWVDAGTFTKA